MNMSHAPNRVDVPEPTNLTSRTNKDFVVGNEVRHEIIILDSPRVDCIRSEDSSSDARPAVAAHNIHKSFQRE